MRTQSDGWADVPQPEPRNAGEWIERRGVSATYDQLLFAGYDPRREVEAGHIVQISLKRGGSYASAAWFKQQKSRA